METEKEINKLFAIEIDLKFESYTYIYFLFHHHQSLY